MEKLFHWLNCQAYFIQQRWRTRKLKSAIHIRGRQGESRALRYLLKNGLRFEKANFRVRGGEIDLIFREGDCLVFVEVRTRSGIDGYLSAHQFSQKKRKRILSTSLQYRKKTRQMTRPYRFDLVVVLDKQCHWHRYV